MQTAGSSKENAQYNDEVLFLDGVNEFHPDVIAALSAEDRDILKRYYLTGGSVSENVFEYRKQLVREQPQVEAQAKAVFAKVLKALNIETFEYSTK